MSKSNQHWINGSLSFFGFLGIYIIMGFIMLFFESAIKTSPLLTIITTMAALLFAGNIIRLIWHVRKSQQLKIAKTKSWSKIKNILKCLVATVFASFVLQNAVIDIGRLFGHVSSIQSLQTNQTELNQIMNTSSVAKACTVIIAIAVAPVVEETLYRGLLIGPRPDQVTKRHVTKRHRIIMTIIAITLFTFVHVINQSASFSYSTVILTLASICQYGTLATVLSINYYRTGNLLHNIILHGTWNCLTMLLALI